MSSFEITLFYDNVSRIKTSNEPSDSENLKIKFAYYVGSFLGTRKAQSVGTVTKMTRVRFPEGRIFSLPHPRPDRLWIPPNGGRSSGVKRPGVKMTTNFLVVPRLRMHGAIPPLRHTS
jgi:hypothetical protein